MRPDFIKFIQHKGEVNSDHVGYVMAGQLSNHSTRNIHTDSFISTVSQFTTFSSNDYVKFYSHLISACTSVNDKWTTINHVKTLHFFCGDLKIINYESAKLKKLSISVVFLHLACDRQHLLWQRITLIMVKDFADTMFFRETNLIKDIFTQGFWKSFPSVQKMYCGF